MSVAAGIRFRYLVSQLTQQEKQLFINSLDHDFIIKALFYYAGHQLAGESQIDPADDVTQMVSNIIQCREPQKEETNDITCKTLDQLPQRLIGNVASYLVQSTYEAFSQSNRAIYLGCNSPNLVHDLQIGPMLRDNITKMPRYPFAKHVQMHVDALSINQADIIGQTLCNMNRLQTLSISLRATCQSQFAFEYFAGAHQMRQFPDPLEFLDITIFAADQPWDSGCHPYWFSHRRLMFTLPRFCNIKYLSLIIRDSRIEEEVFDESELYIIEETFTNLLGLRLYGMDGIGETILRTNHKSLRYLSIEVQPERADHWELIDSLAFSNLKELQLDTTNISDVLPLLYHPLSTDLQQISLNFYCGDAQPHDDLNTTNQECMRIVIEMVIRNHLKLNFLKIGVHFRYEHDMYSFYEERRLRRARSPMTASIFKGIEEGLKRTRDQLRDTFKIWIKTTLLVVKEREEFTDGLEAMMRELTRCNIGNFMVILEIQGTADEDQVMRYEKLDLIPAIKLEELELLESISDNIVIDNMSSKAPTRMQKFVITNKGCNISGYGEQWVMSRYDRRKSEAL